jgi:hypothetical protein
MQKDCGKRVSWEENQTYWKIKLTLFNCLVENRLINKDQHTAVMI